MRRWRWRPQRRCHQSFTSPALYGRYQAALRSRIDAVRGPDVEVDVHALEAGMATQYHYLEHLQVSEVLHNVERAVEAGYDAFAIGHFTDSGLQAAREVAAIPVLGLGETSMLAAFTMGRRFSLVGINPKSLDYVVRLVHQYGFERRLAGVATMACPDPALLEAAFDDREACAHVLAAFMAAARQTTDAGSEVVIAAGGIVMALAARAGLYATAERATVLDGIAALVHACEAAVRTRRAMGGQYTSRNLGYAPPSRGELERIHAHFGPQIYRSVRPEN